MRLLLKYPTRGRPGMFRDTLKLYYDMMSGEVDYRFFVSMDRDDETMNTKGVMEFLESQPNLSYNYGNNTTKIQAINADMDKVGDWDVLLLVSDDMHPVVKGYDKIIMDDMQKHFPDLSGVLHYNDGEWGRKLNTLSIMGINYYKKATYIYHPAYRSFFCDNEFTEVSNRNCLAVYIDNVIIRHAKRENIRKPDATYRKNSRENAFDRALFQRRKANGFT